MRKLTVTLLKLAGLALAAEVHGLMQVVVVVDGEAPRRAQPGVPQLLHGEGQARTAPQTLGVAGLPQVGQAPANRPMDGLLARYAHAPTKYEEMY